MAGCFGVGTYAGPMPKPETIGDQIGQQTEAHGQQPQCLCGLVLSGVSLSFGLRILSRKGSGFDSRHSHHALPIPGRRPLARLPALASNDLGHRRGGALFSQCHL